MQSNSRPNRLATSTSPYLLQHAHNPVDWYPWGPEALDRARTEGRPILLSIGYAACHWCHVMAHESFEDTAAAAIMNENFVCVKVDREERPDLDSIYMDAVQAMTGRGGWPMTVFLTPDGGPFFAGTYFPPEDRHGLPGFKNLLGAIAKVWRTNPQQARAQAARMVEAIGSSSQLGESQQPLTEELVSIAASAVGELHDHKWGGFGPAPKFPQPMTLEFLLSCHLRGDEGTLEMVTTTLDRMAAGGIYDQLGGGFHRYSTDREWLVPHFEKMLYDNAQLARLYLHAWQVTGRERYRQVAIETVDYLLREMRGPGGGFHSSQDADSEGEEGRFFVWSHEELVAAAGEGGELVAAYFGASPSGNWEGTNILWRPASLDVIATTAGSTTAELERLLEAARPRLRQSRERRVRPATDDKVLAAWNGLAIATLAEVGRALDVPAYTAAAIAAADFVLTELRIGGRLSRAWRNGRTSGPGYVDDHALMAAACLTLYETTFDLRWMIEARRLSDEMIHLFHDQSGGFFQTGADAETLVARPKELFDNAIPSGNSVAAEVLLRLSRLTGEAEYERVGLSALRLIRDLIPRAPSAVGHALRALILHLSPAQEVAIIGDPAAAPTRALAREYWRRHLPTAVLAGCRPADERAAQVVPLLANRTLVSGRPAAYVCENFACNRPVTDPAELAALLTHT